MWVFPVYCRCWYVYSVLSAVLSKIVPVLSKNSETAVIRTFLISRDFCGATAKKAFNIKHFRQIQSRPKPPSKITKQPLTYKTRKFSKKCQFCPPKIQCFCGLPQFEKPNILQFFPSVLSKSFGNDFRIDIWRVVRVVEGAALEIMMPPEGRGFESHRLRHKKHRSSVRITVFFCSISIVGG